MATLKIGSKGNEVSELQQKLRDNGYNVSVDGNYGSETAAAVKAFQSNNGLTADGIYGTQTSSKLNSGNYTAGYSPVSSGNSVNTTVNKSTTTSNSYSPSSKVSDYEDMLDYYEDSEPAAFSSRYDDTINEILDTIKNRGSFDLSSDTNYQQLYNNYQESYQNQAQKAMRDSMANAQLATGGYGSTYSQIAGQQAYDNTMQGMNDQNIDLMQLAYNMYSDDRANDYNMLSAYQSQDDTDYSRYRDTYNDWYNNRNYYANQYQNAYSNDYNEYRDSVSDTDNLYATALSYASSGYDLPSYLKSQFSTEDQAYFDNIKQTAIANASKSGSNSGDNGGNDNVEYDDSQHTKADENAANLLSQKLALQGYSEDEVYSMLNKMYDNGQISNPGWVATKIGFSSDFLNKKKG